MSYERRLLFQMISSYLHKNPSSSLEDLARSIHVGSRTIENTVNVATGQSFRDLRKQIMLLKVQSMFVSEPALAIKEVSFAMGYQSARSFARAIKRVCGITPNQLRAKVAGESQNMLPDNARRAVK
jgi:transcriptional regulator GlxA family with amidase domain